MAYQVTVHYSNGYRCSCCERSWESSEWYDELEEALEQVPVEMIDGEPLPFNGDVEVTKVEVKDGTTGEDIAWASAWWSRGFGKYSAYNYTCWSGYRPDIEGFEVVYDRGGKKVDMTWKQLREHLAEEQRKKELEKAQRDLADAQKRVAHFAEKS
mgnify:CR=1 FL=1